jgi:hypothetical protein
LYKVWTFDIITQCAFNYVLFCEMKYSVFTGEYIDTQYNLCIDVRKNLKCLKQERYLICETDLWFYYKLKYSENDSFVFYVKIGIT